MTLRVRRGLPSLRSRRFLKTFRRSLRKACERGDFRVVHYSVQRNHVHLLVEPAGKQALGNGMKAVAARLARAVNSVFGRTGQVLHGRYHLRVLRTPREVRNALAYVRDPPEVTGPHTWLLTVGWRRHGLVDPAEVPGG